MSNARNTYLREMGIDVWVLRENVPDSPVGIERLGARHEIAVELAPPVALVQRAEAPASRQPTAPTNQARSATKDAVLPGRSASRASQPEPKETTIKPVGQAEPEFLLCFMDYTVADEDFSCVFYLPYSTRSLPIEVSRFADSIGAARFSQLTVPERSELRWPMVKAAHIAQSAAEAKQVVGAGINQRGRHVLVFGQAAFEYFDIPPQAPLGVSCAVAGKVLWPLADVNHYFTETDAKIGLWRILVEIKATGALGVRNV